MTMRIDERPSPRHYSEGATMDNNLPMWVKTWRRGISPQLSTRGLLALKQALVRDDDRLTQGSTCTPPPMRCVLEWPCEGACLVGYTAWQGDGLETVGEVNEFFAAVSKACDEAMGEPASVRHVLNAFDDWPREVMRANFLVEVNRELSERALRAAPPPADGAAVEYGVLRHPRLEDTAELPTVVLVAGE